MTKIGLNFEALLDTVLWALRAGNFLADDAGAQTIRDVDADTTSAERAVLAAGLNYGSVGAGGNRLTSDEDVEVFIDADDGNPTTPYTNWFRVSRGQDTVPVADETLQLFSVAKTSAVSTRLSEVTVGPRADALTNVGDYPASFHVGAERDVGGSNYALYTVWARASTSVTQISHYGWDVYAGGAINFGSSDSVNIKHNPSGAVRGGWTDLLLNTKFYVGASATPGPGVKGCRWEYIEADSAWRILVNDSTTERSFFISGAYPDYTNDARVRFCVGGVPGEGNKDPGLIVFDGTPYVAQSMVLTPQVNENRMGLWVYHRSSTVPNDTHLNNFHSALDLQVASDTIRLLSVSGGYGGAHKNAFSVRADASCDSPGGFFAAPADLAEYFEVPSPRDSYEPGTVMIVEPASGIIVQSSKVADTNVIGVVSTEPGLGLGRRREDPEVDKYSLPIAMSGTIPTKVSTSGGAIDRMDLLVSDVEGRARKAPVDPVPGTIIGKAMEPFDQPREAVEVGTIKVLVWKA